MTGTLPRTRLLLTRDGVVLGEFDSYSDVMYYFGITVTDKGVVIFDGKEQLPHYVVDPNESSLANNHWKSKTDIISDWSRYHRKLPSGCEIYRFLV